MQTGNITMDMGTVVVGFSDTMIKNISFTPAEWTAFIGVVNRANADALHVGLVIGAAAGLIGFVLAIKVLEWKKERDWQKYGEN